MFGDIFGIVCSKSLVEIRRLSVLGDIPCLGGVGEPRGLVDRPELIGRHSLSKIDGGLG